MIARYGSNEAYITAETIGINLGVKRIRKKPLLSIYRNAGLFPYGEKLQLNLGILWQMHLRKWIYQVLGKL